VFSREHAVQEVIVRVSRDAIVGEPLLDEQERVQGGDDLARVAPVAENGFHPFCEQVDFLLDGSRIYRYACQIPSHQGRDHDQGFSKRDLPVGKESEGGQGIDSVPFRTERLSPGIGVDGNRIAENAQERHQEKQ
jgi:hypothetical protein